MNASMTELQHTPFVNPSAAEDMSWRSTSEVRHAERAVDEMRRSASSSLRLSMMLDTCPKDRDAEPLGLKAIGEFKLAMSLRNAEGIYRSTTIELNTSRPEIRLTLVAHRPYLLLVPTK